MNNLSGFLSFHGNVSGQMGSNLITNVEANPAGTPTEILTTIRVGDIIYSIPSGGGGGGGTNNYNDLLNKPKINNVVLSGDLSLSDLGIYNPVVMTGATSSADGVAGYAPRPLIADKDKFLKGDGTWTEIPTGGITDTVIYENTSGTTGASSITLSDSLDNYDALYFEYFFPNESTYVESTPSPLVPLIETPPGSTKGKYYISIYPTYGNRYIMLNSDGSTSASLTTGTWGEAIMPSVYRIHGINF